VAPRVRGTEMRSPIPSALPVLDRTP
jgi:hypothetical protein